MTEETNTEEITHGEPEPRETACSSVHFESLRISRDYKGRIRGRLAIKSDNGSSIEISMPEESMEALVDMVANELAQAANIQTERLREAILQRQRDQTNE